MAFANPLNWPIGWPRTENPTWPTFKASAQLTLSDLEKVFDALGAENPVITTNQPTRLDGGLRTAAGTTPQDTGVAVYFNRNGKEVCIPCDKFNTVYGNLRAIGLTLEYLKRMERYGTSEMVDAAFRGFTALPESIIMGAGQSRAWYEVLQVSQNADPEIIKVAWKKLVGKYHPDNQVTGDPVKFDEVQRAFKESGAA
jgi:hypothetical protein